MPSLWRTCSKASHLLLSTNQQEQLHAHHQPRSACATQPEEDNIMKNEEALAALKRIADIANYYNRNYFGGDDVDEAFAAIMEEADEAIKILTAVKGES
jgi:hypothetical protein